MGVRQLFELGGRVAVITGGSRGLGLQIAEGLAEMGAKLVITARKADELAQAQAHLEGQGAEVLAVPLDIAKPGAAAALVDAALAHFGRIDILVNNAGATWGARAEEHPPEAWAKVIDLNLNALFALTQEVARRCLLPQSKGRIINVGGRGITVNGICPGFFSSKMADKIIERSHELLTRLTPRGQMGGDEDLKGLAVLLASDASAHINGQNIAVDGGMSVL